MNKGSAKTIGRRIHTRQCDDVSASCDGSNQPPDLRGANLAGANLSGAVLAGANLSEAVLSEANLTQTNLEHSILVRANLTKANLSLCRIYGIAAWDLNLTGAVQKNLVVTPLEQTPIAVDDLQVAQFIYMLLNNKNIRDVINTIGRKAVLILGRFTDRRIDILEAIAERLRQLGFLPIVFNFEKPTDRDLTETVMTLASLSLFVIADLTNPRSSPLELQATIPNYMIPFAPIIQ
jgi:Pentapeptide repeats (8 copies)